MTHSATLAVETSWPRLDQFLVAQFNDMSRTRIQSLIKEGRVQIDGRIIVKPREALLGGEEVAIEIPEVVKESMLVPEDIPLDVIFEDDAILVVNKPAGMITHPGTGAHSGTLANALAGRFESLSSVNGKLRPGIIHRLDKDTSGLLVVAKTDSAHFHLAREFEQRRVEKIYLALVWGTPGDEGTIVANIVRDRKNRLAFTTSDHHGREATTLYKLEKQYDGFSLLRITPRSGRTHQIRVHMRHAGYPIFGDALYGGVRPQANIPNDLRVAVSRLTNVLKRQALHAWRLTFAHPTSGERMHFEAPNQADFSRALAILDEGYAV